jgi:hypothetical protein
MGLSAQAVPSLCGLSCLIAATEWVTPFFPGIKAPTLSQPQVNIQDTTGRLISAFLKTRTSHWLIPCGLEDWGSGVGLYPKKENK